MAHFVKQRKQDIAGHEFRESLAIFWRKAFVPLLTGVRERGGVDPGLKLLSSGRESAARKPARWRTGKAEAAEYAGGVAIAWEPPVL
jgi:hypothetical protein